MPISKGLLSGIDKEVVGIGACWLKKRCGLENPDLLRSAGQWRCKIQTSPSYFSWCGAAVTASCMDAVSDCRV